MAVLASENTGHLMKCSALATSASVTSLTVLETVLLSNLTENDNGMFLISFKLVANQKCLVTPKFLSNVTPVLQMEKKFEQRFHLLDV